MQWIFKRALCIFLLSAWTAPIESRHHACVDKVVAYLHRYLEKVFDIYEAPEHDKPEASPNLIILPNYPQGFRATTPKRSIGTKPNRKRTKKPKIYNARLRRKCDRCVRDCVRIRNNRNFCTQKRCRARCAAVVETTTRRNALVFPDFGTGPKQNVEVIVDSHHNPGTTVQPTEEGGRPGLIPPVTEASLDEGSNLPQEEGVKASDITSAADNSSDYGDDILSQLINGKDSTEVDVGNVVTQQPSLFPPFVPARNSSDYGDDILSQLIAGNYGTNVDIGNAVKQKPTFLPPFVPAGNSSDYGDEILSQLIVGNYSMGVDVGNVVTQKPSLLPPFVHWVTDFVKRPALQSENGDAGTAAQVAESPSQSGKVFPGQVSNGSHSTAGIANSDSLLTVSLDTAVSEVSKPGVTQLPLLEVPKLPERGVTEIPMPGVPDLSVPQVPELPVPDVPKLPMPGVTELPVPGVPNLSVPEVPELPLPEDPKLPKPVNTGLPDPGLPDLSVQGVPELPVPEVPKLPSSGVTELPVPGIPDLSALGITDFPVPGSPYLSAGGKPNRLQTGNQDFQVSEKPSLLPPFMQWISKFVQRPESKPETGNSEKNTQIIEDSTGLDNEMDSEYNFGESDANFPDYSSDALSGSKPGKKDAKAHASSHELNGKVEISGNTQGIPGAAVFQNTTVMSPGNAGALKASQDGPGSVIQTPPPKPLGQSDGEVSTAVISQGSPGLVTQNPPPKPPSKFKGNVKTPIISPGQLGVVQNPALIPPGQLNGTTKAPIVANSSQVTVVQRPAWSKPDKPKGNVETPFREHEATQKPVNPQHLPRLTTERPAQQVNSQPIAPNPGFYGDLTYPVRPGRQNLVSDPTRPLVPDNLPPSFSKPNGDSPVNYHRPARPWGPSNLAKDILSANIDSYLAQYPGRNPGFFN